MRLWILNHYSVTPDLPGGERHYQLAKILIKLGWDVTIFASSYNHKLRQETRLNADEKYRIETIGEVRYVWLKTSHYTENNLDRILNMLIFMFRSLVVGIRLTRGEFKISKPDIIIGSSVHLLAVLSAYFLSKVQGSIFLMEVRDLWPQTLVDMGRLREKSLIHKILQRLEIFLYKRAKVIISVLPSAWKYISSFGIQENKVVWIPNGVDLSSYDYDCQPPEGDFWVYYIGAHGYANALEVLIEAAQIIQKRGLEDIRFCLLGDGPLKQELIQSAESKHINNIQFRDPIPKQEVPEELKKSSLNILVLRDLPLYQYGISLNKLFDYLASGRPVVFAGMVNNNPVIDSACGKVVAPDDPVSIAKAIISIKNSTMKERFEMGKNGRQYVIEHHDFKVLGNKLDNLLRETLRVNQAGDS